MQQASHLFEFISCSSKCDLTDGGEMFDNAFRFDGREGRGGCYAVGGSPRARHGGRSDLHSDKRAGRREYVAVLMARDHFRIVSGLWVKDAIEKVVCGGRASFGLGANVVTS